MDSRPKETSPARSTVPPGTGPAPVLRRLAPHLYLKAYPSGVTADTLRRFLAEVEQEMPGFERPFAWIVDIPRSVGATSLHRQIYADHDKRTQALDRAYCAGVGLVVMNAAMRGMVTAVYWLQPPVYPHHVASTRPEALEFCREQLEARGVTVDADRARRDLG